MVVLVKGTKTKEVLTLLILEFGLGDHFIDWGICPQSLNPSYTGIWSRGQLLESVLQRSLLGLNPSYTGIWFRGATNAVTLNAL